MKLLFTLLVCLLISSQAAEASVIWRNTLRLATCLVPPGKIRTEIQIRIWQNEYDDWFKKTKQVGERWSLK